MENKLSKLEIACTAIIFLFACFGIGMTVQHRVKKGSGQLTTENYTEFMQVRCEFSENYADGDTTWYAYSIIVSASRYYALESVTISYSPKSDVADLHDVTFTVSVSPGRSLSKKIRDEFIVTPDRGTPMERSLARSDRDVCKRRLQIQHMRRQS